MGALKRMFYAVLTLVAMLALPVCMACGGGHSSPPPPVAPAITTQPASQTVLEGSQATFTVVATGTAPLSYQWKKDGSAIAGATSASHITPATVLADSGANYTVTVTNAAGSITSSAALLTVHSNPAITSFTAAPTVITLGGSATLASSYTGGTGSIDQGVGAVTSGTNKVVSPTGTTTYILTVDNGFATTRSATATVTVVPAPLTPVITAPATVTTLKTGLTATVPAQVGMSYLWTIANGTITAGATGTQVTFTAGAAGTALNLTCTVTNAAGSPAASTVTLTVVAAPVVTSFVSSSTNPLFGATVTLTPTFTGGTGAINNSIGVVTSGTGYPTAAITTATTYTLTVTNAANDTATASVTATPQTVVVGAISPANAIRTVSTSQTFTSSVSGALNPAITWSATGGTMVAATGAWTAPATAGGPFTITATSVADGTKSTSTQVTVVPAPVTPTITAPATVTTGRTGLIASVVPQAGMTYAWSLTSGAITSATTTSTITFTAGAVGTTTLSCTVTNAAAVSAPAGTFTANIVAAPVVTSLVASSTTPLFGATVTLTPTFTGGTGAINNSIGVVTSGTGYPTAAITTATTYTLTVTNAANDTATASVTATPQTVVVGAVSPANRTETVNTSLVTFSATVTGALNAAITWTASAGTINPSTGNWLAPGTAGGPHTITATSVADPTKSSSTTVMVAALPVATITAPSQAPSGAAGLIASVPSQPGFTYQWSITGGTITAGLGTNQITFTAGAVGTLSLSCTVYNNATAPAPATGNASVSVIAAPVINAFTASPSTVLANAAVTLSFNFTGGTGSIDHGVGTVSSGVDVIVNPSISTTYLLTVTPTVGVPVSQSVVVTVGTKPIFSVNLPTSQTALQGAASVTFSVATTGTPAVTGYQWYFNGGPIGGATTASYTLYNISMGMAGSYYVVATNSLGDTQSNTLVLTVTANHAVSGRVWLSNGGNGVPGVTVSINTTPTATTTLTDSNGNYTLTNIPDGAYTLTPSIVGPSALFFPGTQSVTVAGADLSNLDFQAAIGYTVSGTVTYAGTKTGRIFLRLDGVNGGSAPGISIATTGAFTIRGVSPGTYTLSAMLDHIGLGKPNAANPMGSRANVVVGFGNASGADVTLGDPAAINLNGAAGPAVNGGVPFNGGVLVFYGPLTDGTGTETADSYLLEASTSAAFTTIAKTLTFQAQTDNPCFMTGLTDGLTYYFRLKGMAGATTSNPGTASPGIPIGASTGANTFAGTVTFPGTATGPLAVGLYSETTGQAYFLNFPTPVSPQAFSLAGVAPGTYSFIGILDQNHNGIIDPGDLNNTNGKAPTIVVSGSMAGQTLVLTNSGATASLATNHQVSTNSGGTYVNYSLDFTVDGNAKLPVNVALVAGAAVLDLARPAQGSGYYFWINQGTLRPVVGNAYTLRVGYSDGSSEDLPVTVTTVLDTFATNLAPVTGAPAGTTPTFSWAAPSPAPGFAYTYTLWIGLANGGGNVWQYPNRGDMPSSQLSVIYNTDGSASQPSLTPGATYMWGISVRDAAGNSAQKTVEYIP